MKATSEIIEKAISQVKTSFTKEVLVNSFIPANKNHFGISIVNVRGGFQILLDCTFSAKTGKLLKTKTIK